MQNVGRQFQNLRALAVFEATEHRHWLDVLHTPEFGIYDSKAAGPSSPVFGKNCVFLHGELVSAAVRGTRASKGPSLRDLADE